MPSPAYFIGYYQPTDYYFAHLYEHFLALYLPRILGIKTIQANCGAGYILLEIPKKDKDVREIIDSYHLDKNILFHERQIIISEKLLRDRTEMYRDIYEVFETNSSDSSQKDTLFSSFCDYSETELLKKLGEALSRITWHTVSDSELEASSWEVPSYTENELNFSKSKTVSSFILAESTLVIYSSGPTTDNQLEKIFQNLLDDLNQSSRLFTSYRIEGNFFHLWNQRTVLHFASYLPNNRKKEFFSAVQEGYENLSDDTKQTSGEEDKIHQLARFGSTAIREDTKNSNLKIYTRSSDY